MPMTTAGTRMLRARRKDCNVKPNRRLDRKSSRGMLYENEELRLRTITINAEVEQGQHALKKLRKENEQLRREMWSLRDEYDKMEKLLKEKEADNESDQEKSNSEGDHGRSYESDEDEDDDDEDDDKLTNEGSMRQLNENSQSDDIDNNHVKLIPENETNLRSFDGLSVIDEQTEETPTTESPQVCGTSTRSNSEVNRIPDLFPRSTYEDVGEMLSHPQHVGGYSDPDRSVQLKRKSPCEHGRFATSWRTKVCDAYESRPASPYPCNGNTLRQDSYQKRFQVLQNLSSTVTAVSDVDWILQDPSKSTELPEYDVYLEDSCHVDKDGGKILENPILPPPPLGLTPNLIQERTGPDIFVVDGYSQSIDCIVPSQTHDFGDLETKLEGVKISRKTETHPKTQFTICGKVEEEREERSGTTTTTLAKSCGRRDSAAETESQNIPWDLKTPDPTKLTIDESPGGSDNNRFPTHVQRSVSCQNPLGQDVRGNREVFAPETESKSPPTTDEMPQTDSSVKGGVGGVGGVSKYQTKLMVTLKTPTPQRPDGKRTFADATAPRPPKAFQQPILRYGIKPEYAATRFQTFPSSAGFQQTGHGAQKTDARDCLVSHYAGVRTRSNRLSESASRLPALTKTKIGLSASDIPANYLEKELDVLPGEESMAPTKTDIISFPKPVKIPPVPPPRTTSCPKRIIPGSPMQGSNTFDHKMPRQAKLLQFRESNELRPKDPIMYNPLLLSQPIATSSPTISSRMTKSGNNSSIENLYLSRFQNCYDESSNEDLMVHKSKFRNCLRAESAPGGRKLNKSLSSPNFDTFRTVRRKQSEELGAGVENILSQGMLEKADKKSTKAHGQSNVSASSSSGFDSPIKNDRRKRRVSIQFKKMQQFQQDGKRGGKDENEKESSCGRRNSLGQGTTGRGGHGIAGLLGDRRKSKVKMDETDATTSERERTNSISSRTSSFATEMGSRRKFSTSSNRTYINDEKIPWCGCWGNGCI